MHTMCMHMHAQLSMCTHPFADQRRVQCRPTVYIYIFRPTRDPTTSRCSLSSCGVTSRHPSCDLCVRSCARPAPACNPSNTKTSLQPWAHYILYMCPSMQLLCTLCAPRCGLCLRHVLIPTARGSANRDALIAAQHGLKCRLGGATARHPGLPPGVDSPGSWLRYALGTRRAAAQGPMGGGRAAVRPSVGVANPASFDTPRPGQDGCAVPGALPRRSQHGSRAVREPRDHRVPRRRVHGRLKTLGVNSG